MRKPLPTAARVRELFDYDPLSGVLTRRVNKGVAKAGDVAGSVDNKGYLVVRVDGKFYKVHRIAFLYMTNQWPENEVDHVNRVPSDNRWENLRAATRAENMRNRPKDADNKSGYKGVCWDKRAGKWRAQIAHYGIRYHLGLYNDIEDAAQAYNGAAALVFGEWQHQSNSTTKRKTRQ